MFSTPISALVLKKLDKKNIKSLIFRARGFLMRKSLKHERKWT